MSLSKDQLRQYVREHFLYISAQMTPKQEKEYFVNRIKELISHGITASQYLETVKEIYEEEKDSMSLPVRISVAAFLKTIEQLSEINGVRWNLDKLIN